MDNDNDISGMWSYFSELIDQIHDAPSADSAVNPIRQAIEQLAAMLSTHSMHSRSMTTTPETTKTSPEKYVRIAITKNSKGFSYDTTVSLKWDGDTTVYTAILADLNREADALARLEIRQRELADEPGDGTDTMIDAAFAAALKDGAR
jgi:hypothetical protein